MDDDRLQEHEDMELGFKAWKVHLIGNIETD